MAETIEPLETGEVLGRYTSWGGDTISVAVSLPERVWSDLTDGLAGMASRNEGDAAELSLEYRISLFVEMEVQEWQARERSHSLWESDDLDDDVPF